VPAEQEEIIVRVDAVDVQKSGNDGYQFLFGTREARRNRLVLKGICGIGRGQGGAIYLPLVVRGKVSSTTNTLGIM